MKYNKSLARGADGPSLPNRVVPARWTISSGVGQLPGDGLFNWEANVIQ